MYITIIMYYYTFLSLKQMLLYCIAMYLTDEVVISLFIPFHTYFFNQK